MCLYIFLKIIRIYMFSIDTLNYLFTMYLEYFQEIFSLLLMGILKFLLLCTDTCDALYIVLRTAFFIEILS